MSTTPTTPTTFLRLMGHPEGRERLAGALAAFIERRLVDHELTRVRSEASVVEEDLSFESDLLHEDVSPDSKCPTALAAFWVWLGVAATKMERVCPGSSGRLCPLVIERMLPSLTEAKDSFTRITNEDALASLILGNTAQHAFQPMEDLVGFTNTVTGAAYIIPAVYSRERRMGRFSPYLKTAAGRKFLAVHMTSGELPEEL